MSLSSHLERGKVNDIVDIRMCLKHLVQLLLVGNVALVVLGPFAGDELDAIDTFLAAVVEVVDDDDLVVGFEEGKGGEGADIACASGGRGKRVCQFHFWRTLFLRLCLGCERWECLNVSTYPVTRTEPTTILAGVGVS